MDDTRGSDIDGQASNSDAVTSEGDFSITADPPQPMNQPSMARDVGNAIAGLFGISTANAASVSVLVGPRGIAVGFIMFAPGISAFPSTNLGALLAGMRGGISAGGTISGTGIIAGQINGFEMMSPAGRAGITVNINSTDTVDLDDPARGMTLGGVQGGPLPMAFYPGHVWGQCKSIGGVPVQWPGRRTWNAIGPNTAHGLPLMNGTNTVAMFAKRRAYLLEEYIAGTLGSIWSLRTGLCVVPGIAGYVAPGFGQYATYAGSLVLLRATAAGRYVFVGVHGAEAMNVIDPSTGQLFAPDPSLDLWIEIFSGSQDIRIVTSPPGGYTGPVPSASNPGYGSGLQGVLGVSDTILNAAILSQAAYQAVVGAGGNSGGPDGGPNG